MLRRSPIVVAACIVVVAGWPAPVLADAQDTQTHVGVLAGGTFGLHLAKVYPARADVRVDVPPGVTRLVATLSASDALEIGVPSLYALDPMGEFVARAPDGSPTALEIGATAIEARGYGTYTLSVDCGLCGVATFELVVERTFLTEGVGVVASPTRAIVSDGRCGVTIASVFNLGLAPAVPTLDVEGLPDGWTAVIAYAGPADGSVPAHGAMDFGVCVVPADGAPPETHATVDVVARIGGSEDRVAVEVAYSPTLAGLRDRSNAVIALIDTGINPYHVEFRGPKATTVHPEWSVDGYPGDAQALALTLSAPDYATARAADDALWSTVRPGTLYYVPGTRIVGSICFGTGCTPLDTGGHGTGTASLAAGSTLGEAPDALIVSVTGDIFAGARWAARQPWIDVVSMSLGAWLGGPTVGIDTPGFPASGGTGNPYVPFSFPAAQKAAYESGKRWFTGSAQGWGAWWDTSGYDGGAGLAQGGVSGPAPNTWLSPLCGSPWTFVVEPYWPWNEQTWRTQGFPPDMVAQGWDLVAASPSSFTGTNAFGHSSGATPQPAGMYARIVQDGRMLLGSSQEGAREGVLARAPPGAPVPAAGPLADGELGVGEAEAVLLHSLEQVDVVESMQEHGVEDGRYDDDTMPGVPGAEYATQGYGLLTDDARALALSVLRGDTAEPLRPDDDAAYLAGFAARLAIWEPHVQGEIWVF